MPWPDAFAAITKLNEPLAPHTVLKIGGPAEYFVQPRTSRNWRPFCGIAAVRKRRCMSWARESIF